MAGESPDKSEQRKSSGETARGVGDPRLEVVSEGKTPRTPAVVAREPGGTGTAPDAAAEPESAAAVDGDPGRASAATEARRSAPADEASAPTESGESESATDGSDESPDGASPDAESDGPEDGGSDDAAAPDAAAPPVDRPTAAFATVRSASSRDARTASPSAPDGVPDSGPAPVPGDAEAAGSDSSSVRTSESDADRPVADTGADSAQGSPVVADDKPAAEPSASAEPAIREGAVPSGDSDEAGPPETGGADRPTAVFRALQPAAPSSADDSASAGAVVRSDAAGKAANSAEHREGKSGPGGAKGSGAAAGPKGTIDQPTTAFTAVRPPAGASGEKPPGAGAPLAKAGADTDRPAAEPPRPDPDRPSRFVPLRSAELPAEGRTELPESERTKQQPLPPEGPAAPLDLLAQLTNTPPPPETSMRTVVRRVKIWTPLVLLLAIVFCVVQAVRPLPATALELGMDSSYTFDGAKLALPWPDQGQSAVEVEGVGSLGTSGAQKPVPIASVTKVMTAYLVLKAHPLTVDQKGPSIRIDAQAGEEAKAEDESRVRVTEGQQFTERQMLELLLIPSGNNIARQLARWDAHSEQAFVKKMNETAKKLGMKNTTYTDPSGLKASTKSTAVDQLKLARAAMQSEAFRAVVAIPNIHVPGVSERIFNNNNLLVKPGVVGIKTGSSTPAGGALMWAAEKTVDGKPQRILGVVLEQQSDTGLAASLELVQTNSYKLITAVQNALTSAVVVKKGQVVGHVDDGLGGTTPVVATKDLTAIGWPGLTVNIEITDGGKGVPHKEKTGAVIGELRVGSGPGRMMTPVALQADLSEPSFGAKLGRVA